MNRQLYRAIGTVIVCLLGYRIVVCLFPYILGFLAAVGAWHLYEQYEKNRRR